LSLAEAYTVTVWADVKLVPDAGLVIDALGGVVSPATAMFTFSVTGLDVVLLPRASYARAVHACEPLTAEETLHDHAKGAVVSLPRRTPLS
jgi:hypothetical protein